MQNGLGAWPRSSPPCSGIAITVVSIVVQLAANRYTSRVTDMFFRDRTNLAVMGLLRRRLRRGAVGQLRRHEDYVPEASIVATLVMATTSLLMLVPYFAYVFASSIPRR
jgi:uncharacterized membrane protein